MQHDLLSQALRKITAHDAIASLAMGAVQDGKAKIGKARLKHSTVHSHAGRHRYRRPDAPRRSLGR
jgi:hypothetical protein